MLAWDIWNEPDNGNESSYAKGDPRNKNEIVLSLVPQVFAWARSVHPTQPLTSVKPRKRVEIFKRTDDSDKNCLILSLISRRTF